MKQIEDTGYYVTKDGQVWSEKSQQWMTLYKRPNGYLTVGLRHNGKQQQKLVHRLVAEAFLPNPQNLPQVNHKDENKENNNVDNLEWCTAEYNSNYGSRTEKSLKNRKGLCYNNKKVIMYNLKTNDTIKIFNSITEANLFLGKNEKDSTIGKVCNGKRKSAYGYGWKFCTKEDK